jgi:diaminohydroxyphosphoribosylaminopyrimidine deaminase / 5-amino-6-(5-phosphoribosylamino)uracil reductase
MPSKSSGQARKIPLGSYKRSGELGTGEQMAGSGQGMPAEPGDAHAGPGRPAKAVVRRGAPAEDDAATAGRAMPGDADADRRWLAEAIELSRRCPPSASAFSVGAILVAADGDVIATGFSRERDPHDHAEEAALAKAALAKAVLADPVLADPVLADPAQAAAPRAGRRPAPGAQPAGRQPVHADPRLPTATLYSSLEPCAARASRPRTCAELVIAAGLRRVVIAWLEPPVFVDGGGARRLRAAGVTVIEIPELAAAARAINAHLLPG